MITSYLYWEGKNLRKFASVRLNCKVCDPKSNWEEGKSTQLQDRFCFDLLINIDAIPLDQFI